MEASRKEFTEDEISQHNTREDAWVTFKGRVYNVTEFLEGHPGGADILLKYTGKDTTKVMTETNPHSEAALENLMNFEIGNVKDQEGSPPIENSKRKRIREQANINLKEPILTQLFQMENPKIYQDWVHTPIITSETDQLYLFQKNPYGVFEMNTKTKWWLVPLIWLPVSLYFLILGFQNLDFGKEFIGCLLFGIIFWSFTEYFLHGIMFHYHTESWLTNMIHFAFHGVHHLNPYDKERLVFPPLIAVIFIAFPLYSVFISFIKDKYLNPMISSFLFGYVCYDVTHFYLHHGTFMFGPLKYLKKCHMDHHFHTNGDKYNFGVSLFGKPIDFLLGTNKSIK